MKRSLIVTLTLALSSFMAWAQDRPQNPSDPPAVRPAAKPLTVFGKLSADGRTLLTDIDTEWSIVNAEVLKGREGSVISIKCYVDPDRNQLRVLSVRNTSEVKYASRSGDSAFRR